MTKRIAKALAEAGIGARRKCDELVCSGRVAVNGTVVKKPQTLVNPAKDTITVSGKPIQKESKRYYLMHKPRGFECTHAKMPGKKLIYDLFENIGARLFCVGRLDRDTTGLLILTNDGEFANRVIHPSSNISKEYLVKTNKEITHQHLVNLSQGAEIEGSFIRPVKVKKVRKNAVKIAVKEGKKHEVRILIANTGMKVLELKRIRIGNLQLGNLLEGDYRPMKRSELTLFDI